MTIRGVYDPVSLGYLAMWRMCEGFEIGYRWATITIECRWAAGVKKCAG